MCSGASAVVEQVLAGVGGLDEEILILTELRDRVDAALVERVGVFDVSEAWAADGAYSFPVWLRARADISRGESLQLARFAQTLRSMPATQAAVKDGKLSVAKARLLAGVINERTRARFDEHESFLVDQVQGLDVDAAKVVLRHWQLLADTDGPDPADPARNRASMTQGWDGRWHLDADLDPTGGALVKAVLDAIVERMHNDGRFSGRDQAPDRSQQRAEALEEMALRSTGTNPDQSAVRPDIVVLVPVDRFTEDASDPFAPPPVLVGSGPISLLDVLRLALLGTLSIMTVDADGRPLNLGRRHRLASADQWIALRARDRGCVVPGCDRPAGFCQAHHLTWWDRDGGPTDLANLCLTCSAHHHLIHDEGWGLHQDPDGTWQLTRPDGTTVPPARYPDHHRPPPRARPSG